MLAKLFSNVVVKGSCWVWQLGTDKNGYALYRIDGTTCRVSRAVYKLANNCELRESQHVLHTCDVPSCINPAHLYLGTHQDNMADMVAKNRAHKPTGELNGRAKITREIALAIRADSAQLSNWQLVDKYKVHRGTVYNIVAGRTWI
jgi:hypothetical protein